MKKVYPIAILPKQGAPYHIVSLPDFAEGARGDNEEQSILHAIDTMGQLGAALLAAGKALPEPSAVESVRAMYGNCLVVQVEVDFDAYPSQPRLRLEHPLRRRKRED